MPNTVASTASKAQTAPPSELEIDDFVVELLSQRHRAWPFSHEDSHADAFLDFARNRRLSPLLHQVLVSAEYKGELPFEPDHSLEWPARIQESLQKAAKAETAFQLLRDVHVERLVVACREVDVEPIFFKGYALGHTVYSNACTRPSVDVDLIARPADIETIVGILESQGFELFAPYRGKLHSNELVCRRALNGVSLEFDCHSAINNRPLLAKLLRYEELRARAVPVKLQPSQLSSGVLVPCLEHSLLLACIHKVAHNNTDDLLWLSDFSHIANTMSQQQVDEFVRICAAKSVSRICAASIRSAGDTLMHPGLCAIADRLESNAEPNEPTAIYLRDNRSATGDAFVRWKSLNGIWTKAHYVAELLFPSRRFLKWKYGTTARFPFLRNVQDLFSLLAKAVFSGDPSAKKRRDQSNRQGPN